MGLGWWIGNAHEIAIANEGWALAERCRAAYEAQHMRLPLLDLHMRFGKLRGQVARGERGPTLRAERDALLEMARAATFELDERWINVAV